MTDQYFYNSFAAASERRWNVERDLDWRSINKQLALSQYDILAQLRQATLIEAYHPVGTRAVMELLWYDVDATAILSVELFEGFRHFWTLRRYLDAVEFEPHITNTELIELRKRNLDRVRYTTSDKVQVILNFAWSEHFAAYFFKRLAQQAHELVLRRLMEFIAQDEFRHAAGGFHILRTLIAADPSLRRDVLRSARGFRHYGNDVGEVPMAQRNDMVAISAAVKATLKVCGATLQEYAAAPR